MTTLLFDYSLNRSNESAIFSSFRLLQKGGPENCPPSIVTRQSRSATPEVRDLKRRISMRSYLLEESKEKWKREILPTNPFNPSPHSFRTLCRKFVQNFMRPFEFRIDYRGKRGRSPISTRASIINQPFRESWRN